MRILFDKDIDRAQWAVLVQKNKTGNWFQTPEAYEFFAAQPELFKPFAYALVCDPAGTQTKKTPLRGVCCGYISVEKSAFKQFLTRRAIIVGGPCFADDCADEEVIALMSAVRKELKPKAIYIECRNFNDYSRWKDAFASAGFEYVPHLNFHVDTSSVEVVEANLGKSRKRDIRTSLRDGATIIEQPTLEQVREYYAILEHLYKTRVKTPLFPFSFFEKLWQHKDGRFILVALNNEIIGGTVCVEQEGKCLFEWFACGRDGEWKTIFPSCYATYAGIRYAAEHGCVRFDMMGAGKPDEAYGVRDFKAKFGGKEVEHGRFLHINHKWLYRHGAAWVTLKRRSGQTSKGTRQQVALPGTREWEMFVKKHPDGTIFHTPQMYAVYAQTKRQKPLLVSVKREGKMKGLLLADIQWNGGYMTKPITARSIIIGGPLIENNDADVLRELMMEYRKQLPQYVVYSEIRPVYELGWFNMDGWQRVGHYNLILKTEQSEADLWNGMHKERRRNVGQAEKAGLRFEEVRTEEGRKEVIALLHKTYVRKHVPIADDSMFFQLAGAMPENVHFFAAYHDDKMIAGQIRLGYKELLYAWYAGSDEQYFKLRPNDFLMWNVIKWAHEKGYTHFDFGGGGEPGKPYGVRDYKLKYGCEMKDYGRWICVKQPIIYGMAKQMYAMLHKE